MDRLTESFVDIVPPFISGASLQTFQRPISQPFISRTDIEEMGIKQFKLFTKLDIFFPFFFLKRGTRVRFGIEVIETFATDTTGVRVVFIVNFKDLVFKKHNFLSSLFCCFALVLFLGDVR
jgi:hypothetical protein